MDCEDARRAIPAWLYDDRPDADRVPLEAHLEACAECGAVADRCREAMRLLDRWTPSAVSSEPDLARMLAARLPAPTAWRWAPLTGWLAAAAALFLLLVFLTAEIRFADGRFTLAIGRPARELQPIVPVDDLRPFVRTEMRSTLDDRIEDLAGALDELLDERQQEESARLVAVTRTLQLQRSRDLDRIGRYLDGLERDLALVSQRAQEGLEAPIDHLTPTGAEATRPSRSPEQEEIR